MPNFKKNTDPAVKRSGFKMKGFPEQETKAQRKAGNKAYRQSLKADRKRDKENKPFVQGTKNVSQLLGKLENPEKTREKHTIKKGAKNIATAIAGAGAIQTLASKLKKDKKGESWIHRLGRGNPNNL